MVQAIENRADIEGTVFAVKPDPLRPGYCRATIEIGAVKPVEDYANLFTEAAGKHLDVVLPQADAQQWRNGTAVRCRIRRADPATIMGENCAPR